VPAPTSRCQAFAQAGNYTFQVVVTNSKGASSTATVDVTVNQTETNIAVSPGSATVADGTTKQFTATAFDQFGHALTTQPAFTWLLASGGSNINPTTGLYTAPSGTGTDTVRATAGTATGTASVTYAQPPTILSTTATQLNTRQWNLAVTASDPNPGGSITGYSWSLVSGPAGATFGSATASSTSVTFAMAGTYQFQVTVTNAYGISSIGAVTVTVQQTLSSISLSPSSVTLNNGQTQRFTATASDQFGNVMTTQPTFMWS
jgi:hypothetical protein